MKLKLKLKLKLNSNQVAIFHFIKRVYVFYFEINSIFKVIILIEL
jgi:hypothetical protein